ncbi:hypothetical protein ACJX0J_027887, partial [Zea mays]
LQNIKSEIADVFANPQDLLLEALHSVGYSGALTKPLMASESAVNRLDVSILEEFVADGLDGIQMLDPNTLRTLRIYLLETLARWDHHCRNCGDIFCDKCTQGRIPLTTDADAQPVRVCDRRMKISVITTDGQDLYLVQQPEFLSIDNCRSWLSAFPVRFYLRGALERSAWSGEATLSRLVGALIAFKPLYSVLKLASREVIIRTTEKSNIPWREMTKEVLESDVYEVFERIQDPNLVYPDYYLNLFHAYDEGNLSWLAATEAEPATMSIAKRAIPEATSIEEANQIVCGNWLNVIEEHRLKYLGSSQEEKLSRPKPIRWVHANGEATDLSSDSFDLVSLAYVCHECPARAITGLVKEAFRVLRPGETIALTDNLVGVSFVSLFIEYKCANLFKKSAVTYKTPFFIIKFFAAEVKYL